MMMLLFCVAVGWGGFHLGFSNNTDPEPGRCRRTDGKKWRCSRDAVVDQKYCERHMNRGRHRSRKPVEGQSGHALTTTTTTTTTTTPPNASSNSIVVPGNNNNNTFAHNNVHHPLPSHSSPANTINRWVTCKLWLITALLCESLCFMHCHLHSSNQKSCYVWLLWCLL